MVSDPIQAYCAGCGSTRQPLAMYGLLICCQRSARSPISSRPSRVQPMQSVSGLATRTPWRWFTATVLVQGSTRRQTPGGLELEIRVQNCSCPDWGSASLADSLGNDGYPAQQCILAFPSLIAGQHARSSSIVTLLLKPLKPSMCAPAEPERLTSA